MKHVICLLCAICFASFAGAHSTLVNTTPSAGAVLSAAPETLSLEFAQPIRLTLIRVNGQNLEVPSKKFETGFDVTLPSLAAGSHTIEWRGLSDDGHPVSDTFRFELE